jgi:beta-lactamase class D
MLRACLVSLGLALAPSALVQAAPVDAAWARAAALLRDATPARGCEAFAQAGTTGTFVLLDTATGAVRTCDTARAAERFLPASTFKIPNALHALESGLLADEHVVLKWDGVDRGLPQWNRDADLERGMRDSVVWFYQALARGTGAAAMQAHVDKLEYGNRDLSGGLDRFWLDGGLRISAAEQVVFLDALRRRALPLSRRSQDIVARILERERGAGYVWRGKTGLAIPLAKDGADLDLAAPPGVGWLVGWVERPEGDVVYALNLAAKAGQPIALRAELARRLLAANGVLPDQRSP